MANAMVALATTTLGSAASSITFGSIPATYRDLRIVHFVGSTSGNQDIGFKINGSTGTSVVYMVGTGTVTASGGSSDVLGYVNSPGLLNQIDIMDYSATDKHKSGLVVYGSSSNFTAVSAFRWASTAAVTSIQFYLGTGTFSAGSTFALYGIAS